MPEPAPWTNRRLVDWTVGFLKKHNVPAPQREARILLGHVLDIPPIEVIARFDDEPEDDAKARFRELIKRRVEGVPVAYLTGKRDFYTLAFAVSPAVLIPRPDTEALVLAAIDRLAKASAPDVLELGTGSGCVAVSLAHAVKSARVVAVDLSEEALEIAKRNATTHGVSDRVRFVKSDWLAGLDPARPFDLIVSNPPYIAHDEFATLDATVRDHEPRLALDGGPDGLDYYRRTATDAKRFLKPSGAALVEVGHTQAASVQGLFRDAGWEPGPVVKDLARIDRVVSAVRPRGG